MLIALGTAVRSGWLTNILNASARRHDEIPAKTGTVVRADDVAGVEDSREYQDHQYDTKGKPYPSCNLVDLVVPLWLSRIILRG